MANVFEVGDDVVCIDNTNRSALKLGGFYVVLREANGFVIVDTPSREEYFTRRFRKILPEEIDQLEVDDVRNP